ncbi:class I SAM-dependent methyltransferase [Egicoccus sp. AB-alg2]|uniref:class I SAM-dependent methyltransferase n=1 Tax=Egicoccus sp. AB-alg2 TaxID=3242693 RepID=UPI00359D32CC
MPRLFAALYDHIGAGYERTVMRPRRHELLREAHGTVVELGAGTGANLDLYPDDVEVLLTEPDPHMRRRLQARAADHRGVQVLDAAAEALPLDDATVDTVVATLVLCSVGDPSRALAAVHRVLRPGGRLLFLEHVRSPEPRIARWQDRLVPVTSRVAGNCHPNRDTVAAVRDAGFRISHLVEHGGDALTERLQPVVQGVAIRTSTSPASGQPAPARA